jgi:hypothetical protein
MVATDIAARWARVRAEQIEREQADRAERKRQLGAQIKELEAEEISSTNSLIRARRFDATSGLCPSCLINEGVGRELKPVPGPMIVVDNLPETVDIMVCPKCGWDDTVA